MKIKLLLLAFSLMTTLGFAQADGEMIQEMKDDFNYGEFNPSASHVYYGVRQKKGTVSGDVYYDAEWRKASVVFYHELLQNYDPKAPDSIAGYQLRVDLNDQVVEFNLKEGVKALEASAIKRIYLNQGPDNQVVLINIREMNTPDAGLKGFVALLCEGNLTVVKYTYLKLKAPTYNVALDVGEKDAQILKKTDYYYIDKKGNTKNLVKFKPTRKKLLELMHNRKSQMEKFFDDQSLNMRKDDDLRQALQYYNKLGEKRQGN